jgi:hypothetical protein
MIVYFINVILIQKKPASYKKFLFAVQNNSAMNIIDSMM